MRFEDFLAHHGILGQKWGVRRFQNRDGSLTDAGKAARKFDRGMRKLNRLEKKTNIELQRANIDKYNARAKKAAKIGGVATGLAAVGLGEARLIKMYNSAKKSQAKSLIDSYSDQQDTLLREADRKTRELWSNDPQAYGPGHVWNGKGYSEGTWKKIDHIQKNLDTEWDSLDRAKGKVQADFNKGANVRKTIADIDRYIGYAGAAVAAVSYGTAVVSKVMAHNAKKRITDIGHQKAIEKYNKQCDKMIEMFKDTPYADLVRKKKMKTRSR